MRCCSLRCANSVNQVDRELGGRERSESEDQVNGNVSAKSKCNDRSNPFGD
jgi:hypothetical protein